MLTREEKLKLLLINSFLSRAPAALLEEVAAAALELQFERAAFIYAKSDESRHFYLLIEGRVGHPEVQAEEEHVNRRIRTPGQGFGFAAAVAGHPTRVVSARCELETRVLAIDGEWFQKLCTRYGAAGRELLRLLAQAHASYERGILGVSGWVSVRNVTKRNGSATGAVYDCSLEVRSGEFCAIVGPKDSGKSTLARLIAGLERVDDGIIYLDGEPINRPGLRLESGPDRVIVPNPLCRRRTIPELLTGRPAATAARNDAPAFGRFRSSDTEKAGVKISDAEQRCSELRVAFNSIAKVLVLDDLLRKLSEDERERVRSCLSELNESVRKTIIFTTEEVDDAILFADRIHFFAERVRQTFTIGLARPRSTLRNDSELLRLKQAALDAANQSMQENGNVKTIERDAPAEVLRESDVSAALPKKLLHSGPPRPTANAVKEALHNGRFFWTIEFIPSRDKVLRDELHKLGGIAEALAGDPLLAGFSVTDRVVSERDPDPIAAASHLLDVTGKQPLVHFSGKGRELEHLNEFLERLEENGLENALILTGDRLKEEPKDRRPRYLESVAAIYVAKQRRPGLFVAAALNPFKYREEDAMAQYLKLGKKVGAGADFIITQIGFDMHKYEEALLWVGTRDYRLPLVANVMPMSAQRGRYIRHHQLAGVTVTDSFLLLLEEEERVLADRGASRVLRRLALQILGLRYYGYAGVQITGLHSVEKVAALQVLVQDLAELCSDRVTWNKAREESPTFAEGGRADPAPAHDPWYFTSPRPSHARFRERLKYNVMYGVHGVVFDKGPGAKLLGPLMTPVKRHSNADRVLERIERAIKAPIFGCDTCGICRLAATQYVCPETCPKGLANGACGGTTENLCEFRDRECVHSIKYRIAKDADVLHELETWLIPAVPKNLRYTCSWPPHFRDEGPTIRVIDFLHPEKKEIKTW